MRHISPNAITSLRFFIFGPLACFCLAYGHLKTALVFMILGEITDALDGIIARRTNQTSSLGKIYDPMCDSIFHISIWTTFLYVGWIPLYLVLLFFWRDMVVAYIRICSASHHIDLSAKMSGKVKAVFQAGAQLVVVLLHMTTTGSPLQIAQLLIIWAAAIVTAYSLYDYSIRFYKVVKEKGIFSEKTK